jgi:fructose-bisphosphate aldolase class I
MKNSDLATTLHGLLAPGRGVLAADESFPTIGKRFKSLDIPSTEESRRAYRELLFTTPGLHADGISGVILFDETIRQRTAAGVPFPAFLDRQGMIPGIKVDKGTAALPFFDGEKFTQGLDGLRERLAEYRDLGARFTKWRAVLAIGEQTPSDVAIEANARALALFAALSQEAGLVPLVEPEILMAGDHTIERCEEVTHTVLTGVFAALIEHRVDLQSLVLKTGMILPGSDHAPPAGADEIAAATLRCFRRVVPATVPGIVFLSGGQGDEEATQRLDAICRAAADAPWKLSFSFGRALQAPAMAAWGGHAVNVPAAQAALKRRARYNSLAVQGKYSADLETNASA